MSIQEHITQYLNDLPAANKADIRTLHGLLIKLLPSCKLWFIDGKDDTGKTVSNPQIGYGYQIIKYADGKTKDYYQVGISANTTGISVFIMGLSDKTYLPQTYGKLIGKATVTGYCIKFKTLNEINLDILIAAMQDGITQTNV